MVNKFKSAPAYLIGYAVIIFCSVFTAKAADIYQKIPSGVCTLMPDTSKCFSFDSASKLTYTVGKEVSLLSNLYKFCMEIVTKRDTTTTNAHSRIILVLDCSSSMCDNNGAVLANDPTNRRITAAKNFVDSIALVCPTCQIGVIDYTGAGDVTPVTNYIEALPVNSNDNIARIKAIIDSGVCKTTTTHAFGVNGTYTGTAVDTAVKMIDRNTVGADIYDSLYSKDIHRHIIVMTDGDWQGPSPDSIYNEFKGLHPTRPFPTIHGIYITSSGNPPSTADLDSATALVERNRNFLPADTAKGLYVSGATPATIVTEFNSIFTTIANVKLTVVSVGLTSVTITDVNSDSTQKADISPIGDSSNSYIVKLNNITLSLQYGTNTFIFTVTTQDTLKQTVVKYDTLVIIRNTSSGTGDINLFNNSCYADTVSISIACNPATIVIPAYDTVTAKIKPEDTSRFVATNIMVRAFVPFTDNESNIIALFHLDNNLVNSVTNGTAGSGSPVFTSSNAAFGSCMSSGSFQTSVSSIGAGSNFTLECWIKPSASNQAATIASMNGLLTFATTSDGYLSVTIGNTVIKTNHTIDKAVWQHVAVARSNGSANIYINGIPMATEASANGAISGTLTVGTFTNGLLDEFRISGVVNSSQIQGQTVLTIPTSSSITWNINGGGSPWLPATMWQAGQLKFLFTSSLPGSVIINFFDTSSVAIMWSKNGDPVTFTTTGTVVNATLLDTSHDGYLDGINLVWTDAISIVSPIPTVKELVASVIITTLDGKTDTLHPSALILDAANKTIRIVLTQNSGYWETGWKNATVVLNNIEMTTSGKYFVLGSVIDGATPIPVSSCYEPSYASTPDLHDSLYVTFSEPLPVTNGPGVDSSNILRYNASDNVTYTSLVSLHPNSVYTSDGKMVFVFPYTTGGTHAIEANIYKLSEKFPTGPNSTLTAAIPLCYPVPYTDTTTYTVLVGPSPYIIGTKSTIKTSDGSVIQATGVKIQIKINQPAIQDTDGNGTKDTIIKGTMTVFDAVGNVLSNSIGIPDYSGSDYAVSFIWPATNKRGSRVAGGTYLGRVTLLNTRSNKKTVQIAKIGVWTSK
jgi:hypothetical protein